MRLRTRNSFGFVKATWVESFNLSEPERDSVSAILVLLSGQRLNGVELRGFSGWKIAKYDPC
jgi:hypothetical protein